ncbi:MAG: BatA domain-containing protein [Vicinamibacterales bacterium]
MSVFWLAPAALFGLGLMALPVAIHLLVRQQSRRVEYPSLRFLRQSQLAAFRRRRIQDGLLLACRAAIVVAAVTALAGPVFQTASRSAGYGARVARAVILEAGTPESVAANAAGEALASRTVTRERLADAVAEAVRWLDAQPPAAREILLAGAFRRGSVSPALLEAVPQAIGIRFLTAPVPPPAVEREWPILRFGPAGLVIERRQVQVGDDETRVAGGAVTPMTGDVVRVLAAAADQPLADAALRAALEAGVQWSGAVERVVVAWDGADETAVQRLATGATLVRMDRPSPATTAATAVAAAIEGVTAQVVTAMEPVSISREQLQAWSRPPGPVPEDARPADEGDRRWLWALALALMALEFGLRRSRNQSAGEPAVEARVA